MIWLAALLHPSKYLENQVTNSVPLWLCLCETIIEQASDTLKCMQHTVSVSLNDFE